MKSICWRRNACVDVTEKNAAIQIWFWGQSSLSAFTRILGQPDQVKRVLVRNLWSMSEYTSLFFLNFNSMIFGFFHCWLLSMNVRLAALYFLCVTFVLCVSLRSVTLCKLRTHTWNVLKLFFPLQKEYTVQDATDDNSKMVLFASVHKILFFSACNLYQIEIAVMITNHYSNHNHVWLTKMSSILKCFARAQSAQIKN